jgi:hypothetical protein
VSNVTNESKLKHYEQKARNVLNSYHYDVTNYKTFIVEIVEGYKNPILPVIEFDGEFSNSVRIFIEGNNVESVYGTYYF